MNLLDNSLNRSRSRESFRSRESVLPGHKDRAGNKSTAGNEVSSIKSVTMSLILLFSSLGGNFLSYRTQLTHAINVLDESLYLRGA